MILPILKLKTQKVSRNFLGKEKPTLKQIRQQKLSYLQSSSRFDVVGNKGLARSGSDGAASVYASVTKFALNYCTAETDGPQGEVRIFLPKEKSEQARKGRRDLILPILKLKTQKVSRNFLGKEKPTLKQIRQQKLSYLQSSSRFDVVGNKGLARSGSDGAASVYASVTKFALNYCTAETDGPQGEVRIFCQKKNPNKPKGDVRIMVGNKGLEPLTFSTSRRHSPN